MGWGWSKKRYSPIAVDFGADSLKLLQIIPSDPPQLVAAASIDLPEHVRTNAASREAFFSEALKELLGSVSFKGRRAICAIPAYQTLVQHFQIARGESEHDIMDQVNQHLRERLNVDPAKMVVRCFPVGQVIREGSTKQEVICVAASRDVAMRYVDMANKAKLNMVGMHSEPQAILKAFAHLYRRAADAQRVTCFIDLGSATTKVIIAHGAEMAFAKTIHYAGDHFTQQIAQTKDISFSDARLERIRQTMEPTSETADRQSDSRGLDMNVSNRLSKDSETIQPPANAGMLALEPVGSGESNTGSNKPSRGDIAPIATATVPIGTVADVGVGDSLDCLLDELQLCLRYHQSTFPEFPIGKLIFLGGESRHVWLCQKIARVLRIGAQLGDPMARLVRVNAGKKSLSGIDMCQPQPGWGVPMGLCLSEANL